MIFPIIMIMVCVALGGGAFLFIKLSDKRKKQVAAADGQQKTANEFVNVKDIKGKYLYTRDQLVLCYLKINPITIDLFSKGEKQQLIKQLTANMSGIQHPFKFLAVSRPVDITPLISELSAALATSDPKQKELLKQEILEMTTFALSGEVVERQFYIVLWEKAVEGAEKELLVKAKDFAGNLDDCGIGCEILEQQNIVRLCNLINNPAYMHLEDTDFTPSIPILGGGVVF
ncbi:hypothetical protein [Desulfosporosinus sp. OT]|uniref:hypothetical protein n=1 Tax=Desulfosporosinus sp. OT TaxID=913865 RepID=UPI0002239F09|nr:hypothetical protein [Desulfosporosinus sp. OT]EGW36646.1 hypothetical protein DOT_5511 [Desulfosporosinus sp. OT]